VIVKTYDYDAFGNGKDADDADTNPFRYAGEYFDRESGTYYLRARYYAPGTGRFTQEDPARDGGNWYTYCYNNPVRFIDPSGQIGWDTLSGFFQESTQTDPESLHNAMDRYYQLLASLYDGTSSLDNLFASVFSADREIPARLVYREYFSFMKRINMENRTALDVGLPNTLPDEKLLVQENWAEVKRRRANNEDAWYVYSENDSLLHQKDGIEVVKIGLPNGVEGVYNKNTGELITDPKIKGTYNYSNPDGAMGRFRHAFLDVVPYFLFGTQG
jgi:RHS repeat-associated protein